MNQTEYLNQLNRYLKKLPKSDYENAMDYFTEYFEEAGEQRAIAELGTPKEAAAEILYNLLNQAPGKEPSAKNSSSHSFKRTATISFMSILTTPYGLPTALGMMFATLMAAVILSCIALAALLCSMVLLWLGVKYFVRGIIALPHSRSGSCILIGTGILGIGLWILASICIIWLYQWIIQKGIEIFQKFIGKKKGKQ